MPKTNVAVDVAKAIVFDIESLSFGMAIMTSAPTRGKNVTTGRIQFMFEFSTVGWYCIPARILDMTVTYDDSGSTTDTHYQPSAAKSNPANKQFVWRFADDFGGTVPTLRVRLYDALTGDLLVDDYTTGTGGTWEKSTNGTSWGSYDTSDKANETTYIRYTPASLGDNIKVRAVLTQ
jgi:hypothetical protein